MIKMWNGKILTAKKHLADVCPDKQCPRMKELHSISPPAFLVRFKNVHYCAGMYQSWTDYRLGLDDDADGWKMKDFTCTGSGTSYIEFVVRKATNTEPSYSLYGDNYCLYSYLPLGSSTTPGGYFFENNWYQNPAFFRVTVNFFDNNSDTVRIDWYWISHYAVGGLVFSCEYDGADLLHNPEGGSDNLLQSTDSLCYDNSVQFFNGTCEWEPYWGPF